MSSKLSLSIIALSLGLTGCASMNNEDAGVIAGGIAGGILGSQIGGGSGQVVATGIGVLAGSYLGGRVGASMDRQDKIHLQNALETSKTGQSVRWTNPDTKTQYVVKPTTTYYQKHNPCRKFSTTVFMGGEQQIVYGRACRNKAGQWVMVK
jgi:surface antigen